MFGSSTVHHDPDSYAAFVTSMFIAFAKSMAQLLPPAELGRINARIQTLEPSHCPPTAKPCRRSWEDSLRPLSIDPTPPNATGVGKGHRGREVREHLPTQLVRHRHRFGQVDGHRLGLARSHDRVHAGGAVGISSIPLGGPKLNFEDRRGAVVCQLTTDLVKATLPAQGSGRDCPNVRSDHPCLSGLGVSNLVISGVNLLSQQQISHSHGQDRPQCTTEGGPSGQQVGEPVGEQHVQRR